ncbi:hypothetical protein F5Y15DRAFT_356910 [Xylariaceae sp. FL0016]|nr:hypothetical protein F5Y15DRAFT_356910 [Xylariaceae sp. FL0016]
MEAIAALSLVGTVCQLVEFGSEVLSQSRRLYKGTGKACLRQADAEQLALDLNCRIDFLKAAITLTTGRVDGAVQSLSDRTTAVTEELLCLLRTVQMNDGQSKARCMRIAFKSVSQRGKVAALTHKLSGLHAQAQMHYNELISEQGRRQLLAQESNQAAVRKLLEDIKCLVSQSLQKPRDHGYEWETSESIMVDDGLGPCFPFPTYLCSNMDAFLEVLLIKFKSGALPGVSQFERRHVEVLDSTGTRVLKKEDWNTQVIKGKSLQISFVMGRSLGLSRRKCPRCFKPYVRLAPILGWRQCNSCRLSFRVLPPNACRHQPDKIVVGHLDVYRQFRLGKRQGAGSHSGGSAQYPRDKTASQNYRASDTGIDYEHDKRDETPAIDLVCRRMSIRWEPLVNILHRYVRCRCIVRPDAPTGSQPYPEVTKLTAEPCPRHNNRGITCKGRTDLGDNRVDPYFDRYGGYDCFRGMVSRDLRTWELLGGEAFLSSKDRSTALSKFDAQNQDRSSSVETQWTQYRFEVNSTLQDHGVRLPEKLAQEVRARRRLEEEENNAMLSRLGVSRSDLGAEWQKWDLLQTSLYKEVFGICQKESALD